MKRRILYPGPLSPNEIIIVTGAVYSATISLVLPALAEGVRARGASVTTCAPAGRATVTAEQVGDPGDWDTERDVVIVDMGEYLGGTRFRYGSTPALAYTRTLFVTPVAEPALAHSVELDFERERRGQAMEYLRRYLPSPHLVRPSLLRPCAAAMALAESDYRVIRSWEQAQPMSPEEIARRQVLRDQAAYNQTPKLERALWQ